MNAVLAASANLKSTLTVVVIVMPIPVLICELILRKSIEVMRASRWSEGVAQITKSEIKAEHRRRMHEVTTVVNVPVIQYEFVVRGQVHRGRRISIGDTPGN